MRLSAIVLVMSISGACANEGGFAGGGAKVGAAPKTTPTAPRAEPEPKTTAGPEREAPSSKPPGKTKPSAKPEPEKTADAKPGTGSGDAVFIPEQPPAPDKAPPPPPACHEPGGIIEFEDLAHLGEGAGVFEQYLTAFGIRFRTGDDREAMLVRAGGDVAAFVCQTAGCPFTNNGTRDADLGSWMLTTGAMNQASNVLVVEYAHPVGAASGVIVDVDRDESWVIDALDASGAVVASQTVSASGYQGADYDGRGMRFQVQAAGDVIVSLKIHGSAAGAAFGLAFDRFSPSRICD